MSQLYAKLRLSRKNNYRKVLYTDQHIYQPAAELIQDGITYTPQTLLDEGDWYVIRNFSQSEYAIDIIFASFDSVDFESLLAGDIYKVDYLFVKEEDGLYFQRITKSRIVKRKAVIHMGDSFKYEEGKPSIILNEMPDAVYMRESDKLYFRNLAAISSIFRGIDQIYREATEQETAVFLEQDFISLKNDFSTRKVKTANRKRIALASDILAGLHETERSSIFSYIVKYCPDLDNGNGLFEIRNEIDLKMLLYGIEQRFYTTPVGKQQRIANSIIPINRN